MQDHSDFKLVPDLMILSFPPLVNNHKIVQDHSYSTLLQYLKIMQYFVLHDPSSENTGFIMCIKNKQDHDKSNKISI